VKRSFYKRNGVAMDSTADPTLNVSMTASVHSRQATVDIVRGEVAFLFFTAVSVALHPGFVLKGDEGGMSNYGLHAKTAVPYTLALFLLALFSRRAALACDSEVKRARRLRVVLNSYSSILVLVLLSSYVYSLNDVLQVAHYAFSTVLIVLVGGASLWMFRLRSPSAPDWLFLVVQLSGDVVALVTALGGAHLLFLAEILANVGFASLLIRTSQWLRGEGRPRTSQSRL
jgi:hypothetical protein